MRLTDILLQIDTYPEPTPAAAIEQATRFAAALGGVLSALAVEVRIHAPSNWLADRLVRLSDLVAEEEAKSAHACSTALDAFLKAATADGVLGEVLRTRAELYFVAQRVTGYARARDLCIVPVADPLDGQRSVAEALVFESGRPVLLFRPGVADLPSGPLGGIVVAWDGSRAAARAMADALPLLLKAREVHVLTVLNEKAETPGGASHDAVRHLQAHGVKAKGEEVDAAGRRIGEALAEYAAQRRPDLLVMGAYGHSRMREFVLGGATEYMLYNPKVPLLLSH